MEILHLLSQRPDSTGSGIYLQAMLKQAKTRNHTNHVVAGINYPERLPKNLTNADRVVQVAFNTEDLPFLLPGMSDVMPYESSRFQDLSAEQLIKYEKAFLHLTLEIIADCNPDIIHSHHLWLLSSLIKRNFPNIPMVTTCHGSDLRQFQICEHLRDEVAEGCRQIDTILALTAHQKEEIHKLYSIPENRIQVIGAGFDADVFNTNMRDAPPLPTFLYCGKLSRAKGVIYLLRALQQLTLPNWHFHLVGSGSGTEKEECLQFAKKLGERITLHGSLEQKKLAELLRSSHIFVLPSLFEGLPLVILEALASGCSVVSTQLPGCMEIARRAEKGSIHLVKLPGLTHVDTVLEEDEQTFVDDLQKTLESTLELSSDITRKNSTVPSSIHQFSWNSIFHEIEKHYLNLIR